MLLFLGEFKAMGQTIKTKSNIIFSSDAWTMTTLQLPVMGNFHLNSQGFLMKQLSKERGTCRDRALWLHLRASASTTNSASCWKMKPIHCKGILIGASHYRCSTHSWLFAFSVPPLVFIFRGNNQGIVCTRCNDTDQVFT